MKYARMDSETCTKIVDFVTSSEEYDPSIIKKINGKPILRKLVVVPAPEYNADVFEVVGPDYEILDTEVREIYSLSPKSGDITESIMEAIDVKVDTAASILMGSLNTLLLMEATSFLGDENPSAGSYPLLYSMSTGSSPEELVEETIRRSKIVRIKLAKMEDRRRSSKVDVQNAVETHDKLSVLENLDLEYTPTEEEIASVS